VSDRPRPFVCEPAPATWNTRELAEALCHRDLRITLIVERQTWRATVRSLRRVVYRAESRTLPPLLEAVAEWVRAGCHPAA